MPPGGGSTVANEALKRFFGTPWIIPPAIGAVVAVALDRGPFVSAVLIGVPLLVCAVPLRRHVLATRQATAARLGLTYSRRDPFAMLKTIPMPLFTRLVPQINHVYHGERDGRAVRVFRFRTGRERGFECLCAMTAVEADWPPLSVSGEQLDREARERAGVTEMKTELGTFADRYRVYARDPYHATAFVDQRLISWLMTMPNGWAIETAGGWLMCYVAADPLRSEPEDEVLELLDRVIEHVPRAAYSLFPRTATG
jgi:hypothetical protein